MCCLEEKTGHRPVCISLSCMPQTTKLQLSSGKQTAAAVIQVAVRGYPARQQVAQLQEALEPCLEDPHCRMYDCSSNLILELESCLKP